MTDRLAQVNRVVQSLESGLELLCVTGVEDQLQVAVNPIYFIKLCVYFVNKQLDVRPTLELLRNAGIKVL